MSNYDDFDLWGLEDQLASGDLAYQYGNTNYGDLSAGSQSWQFDPETWNYQDVMGGGTGGTGFSLPQMNFTDDTTNVNNYSYGQNYIPDPEPQTPIGSMSYGGMPSTNFNLMGDFLSQYPMQEQSPWMDLPQMQTQQAPIDIGALADQGVIQFDTATENKEEPSTLEGITNAINKVGGGINNFLGSASGLLPLLFLGSGLSASNAAGQTATTINQIAEREQAKEDENQALLQQFLLSGFVPNSPNVDEYQQGNTVDWTPTDVLARYREALDDPRYGLQEYMDAEGGQRAESAARRSAKGGRTGLNAMSNLMAMRDYLANGRKTNLQGLYQEAGIAANQDQARLQAAVQQANARMQANSQQYTTDSNRWTSQLNNMYQAANSSSGAAAAIAAAQANGSQYNPILNALAQYMGQQNRGTS